MVMNMEERAKELARSEAKLATAPAGEATERAAQDAKARREAIQNAARPFYLDELGQGDGVSHAAKVQARKALVQRVFALGDARTPLMEANWKTWLNRLDEQGRAKYTIRWAAFLRNQMADLVRRMTEGETIACLRWYWEMTREFNLNRGAFVVPGSLPKASAALAEAGPAAASCASGS